MGKKILLADDSLTIQKVVELTLAGTDYELTCVSNGQKALESLQHSVPDLILADVVMPEKNGYEVCEAVKSNPATAGIPVILLSGTFEPFDRDRADRLGADRVVSKPFHAPHLLDQIEALLSGAAGGGATESAAPEEGPFATMFLDDTIPTSRAAHSSESSARAKEGQEGAPAGAGEGSSFAGAEIRVAEDFAGGPVFLPIPETQPATGDAGTPYPVEEAPASERPPARPPGAEAGLEEISAEEAEAFFDRPAATTRTPASPAPDVSELTPEQIERIAALVVAKLSDRVLREIIWEVVPDVAEMVVKRRIEELESTVE
ncbi:MAG TPA: response regulator [Thermoanaerobaculia bacterium]|nr:response regulator [Thermoanaerobaculia bacterium]